jgi:hypothetical protein
MRRTHLAWLLCLLVLGLPVVAPAPRVTMAAQAHAAPARLHAARAASPSCSSDPTIGSKAWTVTLSDTLAFLGDGQALTILDVGDPVQPACRSHLALPPNKVVTAIQVSGTYAYLALNNSNDSDVGLQIVDVHDPDHPSLLGSYNGADANDLAVVGNLVYLAVFPDLKIIDVSDPSAPVLVGTYMLGSTGNLHVVGNRLYLNMLGIEILDLTDPIHPVRLGGYLQGSLGWVSFSVSGNRAYLLRSAGGVDVLDISSPSTPLLIGTYTNIDFLDGHYHPFTRGFQVIGNQLYIADTRFQIYDVTSPTKAILIGSYDAPGAGYDMWLADHLAYVANAERGLMTGDYGLEIIDISNQVNPFLRGWFHNGSAGRFFYMQPIRR